MSENKNPFTGLLGITSFNDGAAVQAAIIEGATPYCLTPSTGGYTGKLYLSIGGSSTIRNLLPGPPPLKDIDSNSFWVVEFGAADNAGNDLYSGTSLCGRMETTLSTPYTFLYAGKRYILDSNAVIFSPIVNELRLSQLVINVWQLLR